MFIVFTRIFTRLQTLSLRAKILWPVNIFLFFGLACLSVLISLTLRQSLNEMLKNRIESSGITLATAGRDSLANGDRDGLERMASAHLSDDDVVKIVFEDSTGTPRASVGSTSQDKEYESLFVPVRGSNRQMIGKVNVTYSREKVRQTFWTLLGLISLATLLVQTGLSILISFIVKRLLEPVGVSIDSVSRSISSLTGISGEMTETGHTAEQSAVKMNDNVFESAAALAQMSRMLNRTSTLTVNSEEIMTSLARKTHENQILLANLAMAMEQIKILDQRVKRIGEVTDQISERTAFIHNIVFKSQLLSFNAAIEAARAGAHGRGFAVVAQEVGNLARDSGRAAEAIFEMLKVNEKEVSGLITETAASIQAGDRATSRMLKAFQEMATEIKSLESHLKHVRTTSDEQEKGISQAQKSLDQLSQAADLQQRISVASSMVSGKLLEEIHALSLVANNTERLIAGRGRWRRNKENKDYGKAS